MTWPRLEEFQDARAQGLGAQEIEAVLGIQHDSIMKSLSKHGHTDEKNWLSTKRQQEWDQRRVYAQVFPDNPRCEHGTWSSNGQCQHGKIQGRKSA